MKTSTIIWIVVIIIVIVLGFWYWGSMGTQSPSTSTNSGYTGTPSQTNTPVPPSPTVTDLSTASTSTLGTYLIAENGMTLYEYTKDKAGVSNCTGTCATVWPPYTVPAGESSSTLGVGADVPGQIGTITRADGTLQITYNNIPLYYYEKDQNVGDVKGENVGGFGVVTVSSASSSSVPVE
jgi:predicted lipoprotein with Yx(FWY)xxD motif